MLGVEIGSFVFLNSCQMTEFDLITIGNESNINLNTVLQVFVFALSKFYDIDSFI